MKRSILLKGILPVLLIVFWIQGHAQTYCTPTYDYGCSDDDEVNTFILNGAGGTVINDLNTGCAGSSAYDDRTDESVDVYQANTYTGQISSGYNTDNARIWIDFNDDGTFDATEAVAAISDVGTTNIDFSLSIPLTATAGTHRMRVRVSYNEEANSIDPCDNGSYGETTDYMVNVIALEDCTGTPVAGSAVAPASVCAGIPFTISLPDVTIASAMTYQWYSSPSGANNFTAIAGADGPSLSVTSQTVATDYYCEVTCVNSSVSVNSDVITVGQNPANECYCTPSFAYQWMYISNVEFAGITNETDDWAANGYGDYTDQIANVTPTLPSQITVDVYADYYTSDLNVYIDWNQNGVLDDPGEVYNLATDQLITGDATFTLNIIPPVDAVPGNTRMRVLFPSYYADDGPCTEAEYDDGEAEDYTVNVATLDPCAGTPEAGTLSGPASICSGWPFTLSLSGFTLASGMTYDWQESPAGTNTWADITGASGVLYNDPGITDATDYRVIITCTASGESDTSNVLSITMNPVTECYCVPTSTSTNYYIDDFSTTNGVTNITNTGSGMSGNGYGDFTTDTVSVIQSQSFDFSAEFGPGFNTYGASMWIDWGQDGSLDPGDEVFNTSQYDYGCAGTVTVPVTTTPGNYRMRIRLDYWNSTGPEDPCEIMSGGEGEAEDYILQVLPMPPCADATFPDTVGTLAFPTSLCVSGDVHLNLASPMPVASGITYQWQRATAEAGPYTNIGTASSTPVNVYNTNTTYWYQCQVKCDGTLILTSTPVEVEAVVPETPVATDGQHCGPGIVTLSGAVGSGSIFWYPDETTALPISTGDTFMTPALAATTTYYISAGASPTIDTVVGTGTSSGTTEVSPFYWDMWGEVGWKHQYLIKAAELTSAGFTPGSVISRIGVNVTTANPTGIFDNFSVAADMTTVNSLGSFISGLTSQYTNAAYAAINGPNMFDLSSPITWDGTSNIVVQMCYYDENGEAANVNVKYGSVTGGSLYGYSYDGDACDDWEYGPYTDWQNGRPNFYLTQQGCESDRVPITAYIRDTPVVDLGPDEDICGDANQSITLDAGNSGSTYVWDDGSTGQTLTITHSGTHYVTVTNEYGCVSSDTTTKGILLAPEVHLGNDTTICNGVTITLNAGDDGIIYYWNTGDTVHTIDVNSTGTYSVIVTNDLDCTVSDTINVTVSGDLPTIDAILVTNVGPYSFKFEAYNPQGAITAYTWDFGDGQAVSHEVSPTHTYQSEGNYQVTLTLNTATCGLLTFTTSTHIVGVNDISVDDGVLSLYPNPAKDMITIENKGSFRMEELVITNAVGQVMTKQAIGEGAKKQQVNLSGYASGIYSVRIKTDKGYIVRRFEVLK